MDDDDDEANDRLVSGRTNALQTAGAGVSEKKAKAMVTTMPMVKTQTTLSCKKPFNKTADDREADWGLRRRRTGWKREDDMMESWWNYWHKRRWLQLLLLLLGSIQRSEWWMWIKWLSSSKSVYTRDIGKREDEACFEKGALNCTIIQSA